MAYYLYGYWNITVLKSGRSSKCLTSIFNDSSVCHIAWNVSVLSEFFWSAFPGIWAEYGDLHSEMRKNAGQKNSKYGHFFTQCHKTAK